MIKNIMAGSLSWCEFSCFQSIQCLGLCSAAAWVTVSLLSHVACIEPSARKGWVVSDDCNLDYRFGLDLKGITGRRGVELRGSLQSLYSIS